MSAAPSTRTLVLDENLNPRLVLELTRRGRETTSVAALGLRGSADPQLLDRLDAHLGHWVLVTADDALPDSHGDAVRRVRATVATISAELDADWMLDAWRREIVHRWAHAMGGQKRGSVRRYSLRRHAAWRGARRHPTRQR